MTEAEYVKRLPVLATWQAEARAMFVEGMERLNHITVPDPDSIGLVILDRDGPYAQWGPRVLALTEAASEQGFPPSALEALKRPAPPGVLYVLVIGGSTLRMLIEVPGKMLRVSVPDSEEN